MSQTAIHASIFQPPKLSNGVMRRNTFNGHVNTLKKEVSPEPPTFESATLPAVHKAMKSASSEFKSEKYRHVAAVHRSSRAACLSHDAESIPSFLGFRNVMVLVLIFMNMRLIIENFMKYGVLVCVRCHNYRSQDLSMAALAFFLVPCHLFVAYIIELVAAQHAKGVIGRRKRSNSGRPLLGDIDRRKIAGAAWKNIGLAHFTNACLCLGFTTFVVFNYINHPLFGTICQLHALIVWLKNCSYAFTNRDLRHALLYPQYAKALPEIYSACPYPQNITLSNLTYFWWAPTLVYQPVYPRSPSIRWSFVAKRLAEAAVLSVFIWLASAQYAAPLLRNSYIRKTALPNDNLALAGFMAERIMKLSTISLVIWLAGFFAFFQSVLNALAEVMRFGDREFYADWWNSPSVGVYWRTWNKPVYHFMRRHVYSPLVGRGWSQKSASIMVFVFSGFLHELLVGVPTHSILGIAFVGMVIQIPLISATLPLERMQGTNGRIIGNCVFWVSFCLVGQPVAALMYFSSWQAKYGSLSKL
ncbi:hypothetical protein MMC25_004263 [Agyrium rufum]|nr:hypothetical protein [Agyrium rufum]